MMICDIGNMWREGDTRSRLIFRKSKIFWGGGDFPSPHSTSYGASIRALSVLGPWIRQCKGLIVSCLRYAPRTATVRTTNHLASTEGWTTSNILFTSLTASPLLYRGGAAPSPGGSSIRTPSRVQGVQTPIGDLRYLWESCRSADFF